VLNTEGGASSAVPPGHNTAFIALAPFRLRPLLGALPGQQRASKGFANVCTAQLTSCLHQTVPGHSVLGTLAPLALNSSYKVAQSFWCDVCDIQEQSPSSTATAAAGCASTSQCRGGRRGAGPRTSHLSCGMRPAAQGQSSVLWVGQAGCRAWRQPVEAASGAEHKHLWAVPGQQHVQQQGMLLPGWLPTVRVQGARLPL